MKKQPLSQTNPFLKDSEERNYWITTTVTSSASIEGVHLSEEALKILRKLAQPSNTFTGSPPDHGRKYPFHRTVIALYSRLDSGNVDRHRSLTHSMALSASMLDPPLKSVTTGPESKVSPTAWGTIRHRCGPKLNAN